MTDEPLNPDGEGTSPPPMFRSELSRISSPTSNARGIPAKGIDKSYLSNQAGSVQGQVSSALRFARLHGRQQKPPQGILRSLVSDGEPSPRPLEAHSGRSVQQRR